MSSAVLRPNPGGPPRLSLVVRSLDRHFDRRKVLTGASFELHGGEALIVTGPNGAGKSTLLRVLAGLLRPTRGEIDFQVDGQPVRGADRLGRIGYLAPDINPWGELTALENLEMLARIKGVALAKGGAQHRLDDLGLPRRVHRSPAGTLSTGQRQRLKMSMALLGDPALLLLDEPGSNLDAKGREMVAEVVRRGRDLGAVIIATNDPDEVLLGEKRLELQIVD